MFSGLTRVGGGAASQKEAEKALKIRSPAHRQKNSRTYAVGVLCLRQSGALLSNRVRFFRA